MGLVTQLMSLLRALEARVNELDGRLNKNSRNSSKPRHQTVLASAPTAYAECGAVCLKSIMVYLMEGQLLPSQRGGVLKDMVNVAISEGILYTTKASCFEHLEPIEQQMHQAILGSEVVHLDETGFAVAHNGHEAIATLRDQRPDLILMDIQMPQMDGLTTIEQIRQNLDWQDIPIIALTALAMKGDRDRCLAAGANEYLSKPVKLKRLTPKNQSLLNAICP